MGVCVVAAVAGCGSVVDTADAPPHADSSSLPDGPATPDARPDASPDAPVATNCDGFEIPDTTVIPGWTEHSTSGDFSIVGGQLQTTATMNVYQNTITMDGTTETDGCATIDLNYGAGNTVRAIGVVLRWTSPTDFIVALVQDNGSGTSVFNSMWIYEYPGEVQVAANFMVGSLGAAPSIRAEVVGTQVTLQVDVDRDGIYDQSISGTTTKLDPGLDGVMGLTFGTPAFVERFCSGC